jgi:hypothetical protein
MIEYSTDLQPVLKAELLQAIDHFPF